MDEATARRRDDLEQLRRILPTAPVWEAWLERTGELPPDFAALPDCADLPDPLRAADGTPVTTPEAWRARREELKAEFARWMLGTVPPRPDNLEAKLLLDQPFPLGRVRELELRFGAGHQGTLWMQVMTPPGDGPFPVFMTQHNHTGWATIALRRGYAAVVYAGSDSRDDTDTFGPAYPEHDWSRLTRRAWAGSRCIDYLEGLPEIDTTKVAITGHSRNGKLSCIAAALDERFGVVISSSSGTGGDLPSRYCSEQHFEESIEIITRAFPDWFHPRWRFFCGREQKLPLDVHELVALAAPRACLLSIAVNDGVGSPQAAEACYRSAREVWRLLGAEDKLRILWRQGEHSTWTEIIEQYVDWCDLNFGRGEYAFPERLITPWDWPAWQRQATTPPAPPRADDLALRVRWALGEAPAAGYNPIRNYGLEHPGFAAVAGRAGTPDGVLKQRLAGGEYLAIDLYEPAEAEDKLPLVLWLPPYNPATGYRATYRRSEPIELQLARAGFAVACFDPIGTGRRFEEAERFYQRHPDWSLLGKMVRDALDVTRAVTERPEIGPLGQAYVLGYGLGSLVALHLAALAHRVLPPFAGYVLVCPPPPFRTDTDAAATGGWRRWAERHLWLPRLGLCDSPEVVPYDLDELLGAMAPSPTLVVSPSLDREAPLAAVTGAVNAARAAWGDLPAGSEAGLQQFVGEDYHRLGPEAQTPVLAWLTRQRALAVQA